MRTPSESSLFKLFKKPIPLLVMLGVSFLLFDIQYVLMSRLPGSENEMCVMGAGLNASNLLFAAITSIMGGLFVAGFSQTVKIRQSSLSALSLSGIAAIIGSLTVFCTACTIPVISLFGLGVGIGFFTTYNTWFKSISLALMIFGLYQLNKQLIGECERCVE